MTRKRLPWAARHILRQTLPRDWRDDIVRDLEEAYERRWTGGKHWAARLWLTWQVVAFPCRFAADWLRERLGAAPEDVGAARSRWLSDFSDDLRFGTRILLRAPGFSLLAIATFAVGIGATTAIFSLFDAVLITPLPYPEAEQLVQIWGRSPKGEQRNRITGANAAEWPEAARSFHSMGVYRTGRNATWTRGGDPQLVVVADIQPSVSRVLRVPALLGRAFVDDDALGSGRLVLLGFPLWEQELGADSSVVGRTVTLDDLRYTVVGVMPRGFSFPEAGVDLWMPMTTESLGMESTDRSTRTLMAIARLRQDVALDAAQAEITAIAHREEQEYPKTAGWGVDLVQLQADITADVRVLLTLLLVGVGLVLFVACGNLANLLLARAVSREHEIAVRGALGAGRVRILRQLLTESLLLAGLGGSAALFIAPFLLRAFVAIAPADVPLLERAAIDTGMFLFAGLLSVACALAFGLAPALHQTRDAARRAVRGARGPARAGHSRLSAVLLVVQVSLSVVLLVGAGLFVRTFAALTTAELGFDEDNLVTMSVIIPIPRYPTPDQQNQFFDELLVRIRELPSVVSATGSTGVPGAPGVFGLSFNIEGREAASPTGLQAPEDVRMVVPGYFSVLRQSLVRGRDLDADIRADSPPEVVINQALSRKLWPDQEAIGQRIALFGEPSRWREVVGVVSDARLGSPDEGPIPRLYVAYSQHSRPWMNWMTFIVRMRPGTDPGALHEAMRVSLREIDPELPPGSLGTVAQGYRAVTAPRAFAMTLAIGFGLCALLLSVLGLYGLINFSVAQRKREIGVRMALGANARNVVNAVVRQSLGLAAVGAAFGTLLALAATRAIEGVLFGVEPVDAVTYAGTLLVVLFVALGAAGLPAWRATRISPVSALSTE